MLRLLIAPVIIGILAIILIYLVSPVFVAEADTVAMVARVALSLSNAFYATMPAGIGSYINNLNLLIAALTIGLVLIVALYVLEIIGVLFVCITRWVVALLRREKKEEGPRELSPIDPDSSFADRDYGDKVMGRGLDSIDRD